METTTTETALARKRTRRFMIGAIAKDRSLGVVQRSAEDKIFVLRYFSNFYAAILAVN